MFHWLRPKFGPEGPIEFRCEVVIDKPAEKVYALLDWSDPRNAKRELGNEIAAIAGAPECFRMTMPALAGHVFDMRVTQAVPPSVYAFAIAITPMVGRLAFSHEEYGVEPLEADTCRLTLVNTVTFASGLRMDEFRHEVAIMTIASHNALAKIKIHAEQGIEAVKVADGRVIV